MSIRFDLSQLCPFVKEIRNLLAPEPVYLVGGMVRDSILEGYRRGEDIPDLIHGEDWDLATRCRPRTVLATLRSAGITTIPVGIEHGTVMAVRERLNVEITTFRSDGVYEDGRHCQVTFADSIEEDLERRDFTINALAVDLSSGEIVDLFNGLEDLRKNVIRAVGDPDRRFAEDYLRMLRATRLAAKTEATVEANTLEAIRRHAPKIQNISAERIRDELLKLMTYPRPSYGLLLMKETGLMHEILPELEACFGVEQNQFHSDDVGMHSLKTADAIHPRYPLLRLIALFHDLGKPERKRWMKDQEDYVFYGHQFSSADKAAAILNRLRSPTRDIDLARQMIENHMVPLGPHASAGSIRRLMRRVGRENIRSFLRIRIADRKANTLKGPGLEPGLYQVIRTIRRIERDMDALKITDLAIGGKDLIEMGLSPGPIFSDILHTLLERVLDDPSLNTREFLLPLAEELARAEGKK
ncbi:MAG TPA: CCA tRNA nucleotidyltransferase [bacterium]|nr:CCA tRNA nucleotidyltransferase [bacterium]HQL62474.1 CCA tRNA nucleotidyltransferase [bacterium]